jgi:Uma2 family endonuclease
MSLQNHLADHRPVKLTAEDYLNLASAGALDAYSKTELIDGVIVAVSPQHSRHARVQALFLRRLADAIDRLGAGLEVWVEASIRISGQQVPQADIVVTNYRGPPSVLPASTVSLVVEIADTTAKFDRTAKARIYAEGSIPEYWVVDTQAGEVARFWGPAAQGYQNERPVPLGTIVEAATLPGLAVDSAGFQRPD